MRWPVVGADNRLHPWVPLQDTQPQHPNLRDCQGEGVECYVHGLACKDVHENHRIKVYGPYGLNGPFWKTYFVRCLDCYLGGVSWRRCDITVVVKD